MPNAKTHILVRGARLHNLKNIDLDIPKNQLVVITGLSGSGKSTLAFDTLYAEGQRRYVESLSSYARQFLGKLDKPQVDSIKGLAPAIAIEQKVNSTNPRSTVGTTTEIYDYLRLLYARVGETYSPVSGNLVQKDSVTDVVNHIMNQPDGEKFALLSPIPKNEERDFVTQIQIYQQQGFSRLEIDGKQVKIEDLISFGFDLDSKSIARLVIDRIVKESDEAFRNRLADSVQTAFYEGHGHVVVQSLSDQKERHFSNLFELDGLSFHEPNLHFFSFNNPFGACPTCEGYGKIIGIDENMVVPNKHLSIYEDAVVCWRGDKMSVWKDRFIKESAALEFPIHKPYFELSEEEVTTLWEGKGKWKGLDAFFTMLEEKSYKIQYRVMLARYRGKTLCKTCKGKRLRPETNYVRIDGKTLSDLVSLSLDDLATFFNQLELNDYQHSVAKRILIEINNRLAFLQNVGLGYLTLNRASNTLSGGESQRINLATSLGSSLVGSMYILDEPSIGLHSKDTERLIGVLKQLRDLGNTVIVVEHDEDIIQAADHIIDIGPEAGTQGGTVVFEGNYKQLLQSQTLTAQYLNKERNIVPQAPKENFSKKIRIEGANQNNLNNIDVDFPLHCLTVITGVSGSGKSTLLKQVLTPALQRNLGIYAQLPGDFRSLEGDVSSVQQIEFIDQNPIGKSSRSNPVTYVKAYDEIRSLFAKQKRSQLNGYKAKHFSFNVDGGRCDTCKGEGTITIEMQFMANVELQCEECNGTRFKKEIREVRFEGYNISDILELTLDEGVTFFEKHNCTKIVQKLQPLLDVGLGYVQLGQSSNTLSGGEAQRIKLASFLSLGDKAPHTLFIFDEPSTGLHFHDINKLLKSFWALIDKGHSVFVIEHHLDIIKCADWIIDLGPAAGNAGGKVVYEGVPMDITQAKNSVTAKYLQEKL